MIISETLSKINLNSSRIAKLLKSINDEISEVTSAVYQLNQEKKANRISVLEAENKELEKQVEKYKQELIQLRIANDVPHIPVLSSPQQAAGQVREPVNTLQSKANETVDVPQKATKEGNAAVAPKKEKSAKSQLAQPAQPAQPSEPAQPTKPAQPVQLNKTEIKEANFSQLDIRVGQIVEIDKHPNADSLYVEKVNFGENLTKTILSGLVNHVPIDQMKNRLALFLINLKPAKMRNITSEGMIMCASTPEKVEILVPPEGSVPGDIVRVEGYEYKPEPVLNPKKKIYETLSPDMKVNENKVATYKGIPWNVGGKGPASAPSLVNVQIK